MPPITFCLSVRIIKGHPGYWLPEVLQRKEYNPRSADVWGLGVTLYVMLTSRLPFGPSTEHETEQDCLGRMQRGLELGATGPVGSVRLSPGAVELLQGVLHYVTKVTSFRAGQLDLSLVVVETNYTVLARNT